jgi:hypothetical protein
MAERVIDLHRVQALRIVLQEFRRRQLGGIELRLPLGVGKTGRSGKES